MKYQEDKYWRSIAEIVHEAEFQSTKIDVQCIDRKKVYKDIKETAEYLGYSFKELVADKKMIVGRLTVELYGKGEAISQRTVVYKVEG